MEPVTWSLVCLFFILLFLSSRRHKGLPPGWARIPVVGMPPSKAPWLFKAKKMMEGWKKYKVIGHYMGNYPAVTIQDFTLAKELFNREEWCGRGKTIISRYLRSDSGKNKGIIFSDGQYWTDHRRFTLKHLKDFGFGRAGLEGVIQGEAEELVSLLGQHQGEDFKMETVFGIPVINILWTIVAGKRFETNDPKVQRMMVLLNRLFRGKFPLEYILSWWGLICYLVPGLNTRNRIITELRSMFRKSIEEHRESRDPNHPRDYIDCYLDQMERDKEFDQEGLELTCLDLFKAGAETSSTTLMWCVLYLTRYPEVQTAAREEVEQVTGEERPGVGHQLPYCQAVIQEVQRLSCVAPTCLPHRITRPLELDNHKLPEDTIAMINLVSYMQDPDHWTKPTAFLPERFLEKTDIGAWQLVKKDRFVPYGFGRRVCLGEALAKDTLRIFFATLVKHIRFTDPVSHPAPDPGNFTETSTVIPDAFHVNMQLIRPV